MGLAYAFEGEEALRGPLVGEVVTVRKTCLCPEMRLFRVLIGNKI